jgi:hypothetical protein
LWVEAVANLGSIDLHCLDRKIGRIQNDESGRTKDASLDVDAPIEGGIQQIGLENESVSDRLDVSRKSMGIEATNVIEGHEHVVRCQGTHAQIVVRAVFAEPYRPNCNRHVPRP